MEIAERSESCPFYVQEGNFSHCVNVVVNFHSKNLLTLLKANDFLPKQN